MKWVLDSSAMIAFLADEPEAAKVEAVLIQADEEAEGEVYAHAVNLAEVFYDAQNAATNAGLPSPTTIAEAEIARLISLGVRERNDMDGAFWRDIADLISRVRTTPTLQGVRGNLALGDGFGVALSRRLDAEFVTKDRTEIEPLHDAELVNALFIR